MAAADPKWLEILKASGWQTAALTAASATVLYLNAKKRLPVALDSWVIQAAEVSVLVFGFLTVFGVGPHVAKKWSSLWDWLAHRWAIRQEMQRVEKEIPSMTPKECEIIGYLLANNRKMFTCTSDGGYANTLISKEIVVCAMLPGQAATIYEVPFKVPDHAWDVLVKHKAEFPNTHKSGKPYPWAIPWDIR